MYIVHVGEFSAPNYPSLEGGWTAEVDDIDEFAEELKQEYAAVEGPRLIRRGGFKGDYEVKAYEHEAI